MADQSQPERELAESAAELALITAAARGEPIYNSEERGPTPVSAMSPVWAERAAKAGHTNAHAPRVHKALERRAHKGGR
jgi:hypothetical protein